MESFPVGYRLRQDDLNIQFIKRIEFSHGPIAVYDPFYVSYEIGTYALNVYTRIGLEFRVPENVKHGTYRANFIVDDHWTTGTYKIIWKYKVCQYDAIQTAEELFQII